jgi:ABC-type lipoprotein release transport system permease subunit
VLALVATVVVSVAATLYPARLATRVSPVVAMQGKE